MPLLAAWLGSLFGSLAAFFAKWFTKRVALTLAAVAAILSVTSLFVAAITALINTLIESVPSWVIIGGSWVLPDNVNVCIAAYASAVVLKWIYDWQTAIIQLKLL